MEGFMMLLQIFLVGMFSFTLAWEYRQKGQTGRELIYIALGLMSIANWVMWLSIYLRRWTG